MADDAFQEEILSAEEPAVRAVSEVRAEKNLKLQQYSRQLPNKTFHDEVTNTVYTKTDRVGTYCLVDMEIFLDNLDKQLNGDDEPQA